MDLIGAIESTGIPALRVVATIVAVLFMAGVGLLICHKRHQLFDCDPDVDNDFRPCVAVRAEEFC
jgi:hypothetical protein